MSRVSSTSTFELSALSVLMLYRVYKAVLAHGFIPLQYAQNLDSKFLGSRPRQLALRQPPLLGYAEHEHVLWLLRFYYFSICVDLVFLSDCDSFVCVDLCLPVCMIRLRVRILISTSARLPKLSCPSISDFAACVEKYNAYSDRTFRCLCSVKRTK